MSIRHTALAILLLSATTLAACGPEGATRGRTTAGAGTQLSQWEPVAASDVLLNIEDLDGAAVTKVEQRTRDNHIVHQIIYFKPRGRLSMEHIVRANGVFSLRVTEHVKDFSKALISMQKYFYGFTMDENDMKDGYVYRRGRYAGWVAPAIGKNDRSSCVLARFAFLSDPNKERSSGEHFDTLVWFRNCSGAWDVEDIKAMIAGMRIVRPAA